MKIMHGMIVDMILVVVWLWWLISEIAQMRTVVVDENWIVVILRHSRRWVRDDNIEEDFEMNIMNTLTWNFDHGRGLNELVGFRGCDRLVLGRSASMNKRLSSGYSLGTGHSLDCRSRRHFFKTCGKSLEQLWNNKEIMR